MDNSFKEISIRGRLAFGALCLENALIHFHINDDLLKTIVLPQIWEFTNSKDLGDWGESIKEIEPECLLDSRSRAMDDGKIISSARRQQLISLYRSLPQSITQMISDVIEIGTSNLYAGTQDFSPSTLKSLQYVIKACREINVPLPNIELFKKTPFTEFHGWGLQRERQFYLD